MGFFDQLQNMVRNAADNTPPSAGGGFNPNDWLNKQVQGPGIFRPNGASDALNTLQNPGVSSLDSQNNALDSLRGMGVNMGSQGPTDPYTQLQQQLMNQLAGINNQLTPEEELRRQAESQAAAKYDPQIAALQGQMNATTTRGHDNEQQARDMYNALSGDIKNQIPGMQQQNQTAQNDTAQRYAQGAQQMQQAYQTQAQSQQDMMNKLGIQAAAGDPRVQQTANDQQYFTNQNAADAQHQKDSLQQIAATDTGFENKMASNAGLAGENTAQNIGKQLETYLQASQDKLGGLQSGRAADVINFFDQLKNADATRVGSANKAAFDQMMALNNFQMGALKDKNANDLAQQDLQYKLQQLRGNMPGSGSGMGGANNYLAQHYGTDPNEAMKLENILGSVLASPDAVNGTHTGPGTGGSNAQVKNNDEYMMQMLRAEAAKQGVQGGDVNNLIDAYLMFKGQLK